MGNPSRWRWHSVGAGFLRSQLLHARGQKRQRIGISSPLYASAFLFILLSLQPVDAALCDTVRCILSVSPGLLPCKLALACNRPCENVWMAVEWSQRASTPEKQIAFGEQQQQCSSPLSPLSSLSPLSPLSIVSVPFADLGTLNTATMFSKNSDYFFSLQR